MKTQFMERAPGFMPTPPYRNGGYAATAAGSAGVPPVRLTLPYMIGKYAAFAAK